MIVMQKVVSFSTINIQLIKLFKFTKFVKSFYLVYQSCKGLFLQVIKFTQEFGDSTMEHFCPGPPGGAHPLGVKVVQTGAKLPIVQTFSYRRILMLGNGVMSLVLTNMGTFVKEISEYKSPFDAFNIFN